MDGLDETRITNITQQALSTEDKMVAGAFGRATNFG